MALASGTSPEGFFQSLPRVHWPKRSDRVEVIKSGNFPARRPRLVHRPPPSENPAARGYRPGSRGRATGLRSRCRQSDVKRRDDQPVVDVDAELVAAAPTGGVAVQPAPRSGAGLRCGASRHPDVDESPVPIPDRVDEAPRPRHVAVGQSENQKTGPDASSESASLRDGFNGGSCSFVVGMHATSASLRHPYARSKHWRSNRPVNTTDCRHEQPCENVIPPGSALDRPVHRLCSAASYRLTSVRSAATKAASAQPPHRFTRAW